MIKKSKKKKLEAPGWKVGSTSDFLNLSPEEEAFIELKLAMANHLQKCRQRKKLTQTQLAEFIKSSQSRVAKMESGDPSVSIDLLVRCLLAFGTSTKQLARIINSPSTTTA